MGRVDSLILTNKINLSQGIPLEIGNLVFLKTFAVNNTIKFPPNGIPANVFSNLVNMEVLDLSANYVFGSISHSIDFSKLKNLKVLNLAKNHFDDNLNFILKNLTNLVNIDLSENKFYFDDFNTAFSHMRSLEVLTMANGVLNKSPQALPLTLHLSLSLKTLDLWFCFNSLSTLPSNLKEYVNLQSLTLNGNNLYGSLDSLANLPSLQVLQIGSNHFEGDIPKFIVDLSLTSLDLSFNNFKTLPSNIAKLGLIEHLNLASNNIEHDLSFINSFNNLKTLRLSNNSFYGKVPSISQSRELEVCNVLNSGKSVCREPETFIPTNCLSWYGLQPCYTLSVDAGIGIALLAVVFASFIIYASYKLKKWVLKKYGSLRNHCNQKAAGTALDEMEAGRLKARNSFTKIKTLAKNKKKKYFSPRYDYDNCKIPILRFFMRIFLTLISLGYVVFLFESTMHPSRFMEDIKHETFYSAHTYVDENNSISHMGSSNIPIAVFNLNYELSPKSNAKPHCTYFKKGQKYFCHNNPNWYYQSNVFATRRYSNFSQSDLLLREESNFNPNYFLLGSVFEKLYEKTGEDDVGASVEAIHIKLNEEENPFIGGTVGLGHIFNLGFNTQEEIKSAELHKNLYTAHIVPNLTNIVKFQLTVFRKLDFTSGFLGEWDSIYRDIYVYQVFVEHQKSIRNDTTIILLPLQENAMIVSEERRFTIITVVARILTFFTSLLTFYWFLFGRGPFRPWGYIQEKFGLIRKVATKRKTKKGRNLIDWDLRLFLKMNNLTEKKNEKSNLNDQSSLEGIDLDSLNDSNVDSINVDQSDGKVQTIPKEKQQDYLESKSYLL
ncbi:hypothetical protein HK099_006488 [Clydaea vesicula]|uniref:Uncharacterized protein n=1 Tax=Clydaea vesicula TaxID=447962 RepID=A0AAD5XZ21_9FUNG|nr:hypothetical protein HK099_006488 [Clydaea vesicula]